MGKSVTCITGILGGVLFFNFIQIHAEISNLDSICEELTQKLN